MTSNDAMADQGAADLTRHTPEPSICQTPGRNIEAVRRSIGLGSAEEALVRSAAELLAPSVERWVDAFYERLIRDPNAMLLLEDEGRIIRLKRSLTAWFHEILSLPYDERYERAREAIGHRHVEIHMPQFLMVSAISGIQRDVRRTVHSLLCDDPGRAEAVADAMSKVFDMELALMLAAYRRHERALARRQGRIAYAERATRRFAHFVRNRVDAALCHLELARRTEGAEREGAFARLRDVIRGLGRMDVHRRVTDASAAPEPARVRLHDLCASAADNVSLTLRARVEIEVEPPNLQFRLRADAVRLALEELLENALTHGQAALIHIAARAHPDAQTLTLEITDDGPGWAHEDERLADIYARGPGLGLSFCEFVTELHEGAIALFRSEGGGAGVRLQLTEVGEEESHAHRRADS